MTGFLQTINLDYTNEGVFLLSTEEEYIQYQCSCPMYFLR